MVNVPDYGVFHNEGTSRMPARPWAYFDEEMLDGIERVFGDWVLERMARV
jgi:hypothetical protein